MVKVARLGPLRHSGEPSDRGRCAAVWEKTMLGPANDRRAQEWSTFIGLPAKEVSMTPNIADIIRHHVSLEVRCIDRLYLHAYMPKLQTSGGLCYFLHDHRGYPSPSPALFRPMHDRFVNDVDQFVARYNLPKVPFESGQDKDAIVAGYRTRFKAREGI